MLQIKDLKILAKFEMMNLKEPFDLGKTKNFEK